MFYKTYRYRSAKNIVDEIELLRERYGSNGLYFREDLLTANTKKLLQLCDEMKKRNLDLPWLCESRVDTVSRSKLKKMKSAGCKAIWFGCESGSQKVLDYINKEISISQIEKTFQWCKELGIITGAAFVNGFPGETVEDSYKTVELAKKIKANYSWVRIYIGSPKSPMYDEVIKKRYYRKGYKWEGLVAVETPELSLEKISELHVMIKRELFKICIKGILSDMIVNYKNSYNNIRNFLNFIKYSSIISNKNIGVTSRFGLGESNLENSVRNIEEFGNVRGFL